MQPVTVLFAPAVDAALVELIDHVDVDRILTLLDFLRAGPETPGRDPYHLPAAGPIFQGEVRMLTVEGRAFPYEHYPAKGEVHVLDMIAPGRNWR